MLEVDLVRYGPTAGWTPEICFQLKPPVGRGTLLAEIDIGYDAMVSTSCLPHFRPEESVRIACATYLTVSASVLLCRRVLLMALRAASTQNLDRRTTRGALLLADGIERVARYEGTHRIWVWGKP